MVIVTAKILHAKPSLGKTSLVLNMDMVCVPVGVHLFDTYSYFRNAFMAANPPLPKKKQTGLNTS